VKTSGALFDIDAYRNDPHRRMNHILRTNEAIR
jgi:hypothetical protein